MCFTPREHLYTHVKSCIYWTSRQVVYYKLLPSGQTITTKVYSQQLESVQRALQHNQAEYMIRKGVLFLAENAGRMWHTTQSLG